MTGYVTLHITLGLRQPRFWRACDCGTGLTLGIAGCFLGCHGYEALDTKSIRVFWAHETLTVNLLQVVTLGFSCFSPLLFIFFIFIFFAFPFCVLYIHTPGLQGGCDVAPDVAVVVAVARVYCLCLVWFGLCCPVRRMHAAAIPGCAIYR